MDNLTQRRLNKLIHYSWWQFVAAIVLSLLITSGALKATEPFIPDSQKLHVELVSYTADTLVFNDLQASLQKRLGLKKVTLVHDALSVSQGWQLFNAHLSGQTGDVFVLPLSRCVSIAALDALMPLEGIVQSGKLPAKDYDASKYTFSNKEEAEHLYALPVSLFPALTKQYQLTPLDPKDPLVVCIPHYCRNLPGALAWIQTLK